MEFALPVDVSHSSPNASHLWRSKMQTFSKPFPAVPRQLRETHSFKPLGGIGLPRTARTVAIEEGVLERLATQRSTSTRPIADQMNVAHQTVRRVLHVQLLHPYYFQKMQALGLLEHQPRVHFFLWFLQRRYYDSTGF